MSEKMSMREIWQTFCRVAGYYPRVLSLVWRATPRYTLLNIVLTIVSSAVPPAHVWITKVIIDRITEAFRASTQGVPFDWYEVLAPIGLIFLLWVVGGLCQSMKSGITELMGFRVRNRVEYLVLEKASQLDIAFYETPAFFDKMENARREPFRIHNLAVLCIDFAGGFLGLGAMLGLLWRLHPVVVVVLLLTSLPQVAVGGYYASRRFGMQASRALERRMVSYLSDLLGSRDAVKEIRLFGLHQPFLKRFLHFSRKFFDENKSLRFSQERANLLLGLLSQVGTASIWVYAVVQAVLGRITIGDVALAFQAAEQGRSGLSQLFWMGGIFYEHGLFAGNLFRFLDQF